MQSISPDRDMTDIDQMKDGKDALEVSDEASDPVLAVKSRKQNISDIVTIIASGFALLATFSAGRTHS